MSFREKARERQEKRKSGKSKRGRESVWPAKFNAYLHAAMTAERGESDSLELVADQVANRMPNMNEARQYYGKDFTAKFIARAGYLLKDLAEQVNFYGEADRRLKLFQAAKPGEVVGDRKLTTGMIQSQIERYSSAIKLIEDIEERWGDLLDCEFLGTREVSPGRFIKNLSDDQLAESYDAMKAEKDREAAKKLADKAGV